MPEGFNFRFRFVTQASLDGMMKESRIVSQSAGLSVYMRYVFLVVLGENMNILPISHVDAGMDSSSRLRCSYFYLYISRVSPSIWQVGRLRRTSVVRFAQPSVLRLRLDQLVSSVKYLKRTFLTSSRCSFRIHSRLILIVKVSFSLFCLFPRSFREWERLIYRAQEISAKNSGTVCVKWSWNNYLRHTLHPSELYAFSTVHGFRFKILVIRLHGKCTILSYYV